MVTTECRHCQTTQRAPYAGGGEIEMPSVECHGCGADLCENCERFVCTGCDETFCGSHKIVYSGEECCADCALFWAQDAVRKLRRASEDQEDARDAAWRRKYAGMRTVLRREVA